MPALGGLLITLLVLAGTFVAGAVLDALALRARERRIDRLLFIAICLGTALYLVIEAQLYVTLDPQAHKLPRRIQGVAVGVVLAIVPWLVARLTRARGRWIPAVISAASATLVLRALLSPHGMWLAHIDRVELLRLPWGETIALARGEATPWLDATAAICVALSLYGIACAWRYRRLPGAVGAWPLVAFHVLFIAAVANDVAIDELRLHGLYLGEFTVPLLVVGIWWRLAVEHERRVAAYRALFARSIDAMLVADPDSGAVLDANDATRALFTGGAAMPAELRALVPPGEDTELAARAREVAAGPAGAIAVVACRCARAGGEPFPAEVLLHAETLEGRRRLVVSVRDLGERVRAEAHRRELEAQVQHAQKLESIGLLAGGVAHDFNNILMSVLGRAELAESALATRRDAQPHLIAIRAAAERAAGLCRQLLAYAGRASFTIAPLDLGAVVREMSGMLAVSVSKQVALRLELDPRLPAVQGDVDQVRQVAMNLITNASDAIGDRPGTITLRTGQRECGEDDLRGCAGEALRPGRYVVLEVHDTGCGMDEAACARVFEPFFTTKFTGRGLGMAAVLGIVRAHHAGIRIDSVLGRGTAVRVHFPIAASASASASASAPIVPPAAIRPERGGVVLVVDDEENVRDITRDLLDALGLRALEAGGGRAALEILRAARERVDCVLLDLTMPDLDGMQTLRLLREIDARLPVILASGYAREDVAARIDGDGRTSFLQKPFDLAALGRTLHAAMAGSAADPPASTLARG